MNKITELIPKFTFLETSKNALPISKEDLVLCANGLFALGAGALESLGYSSWGLRSISTLTNMMGIIGESVTSVKTVEEANAAAIGVALAGAKILAYNKMHSYPALKPILLVINAYGTYAVVQRAYHELSKCYEAKKADPKGELNWNIARNVFIHSLNASYSAYRTYNFLCSKGPIAPSKETKETPQFRDERTKTLVGISKIMNSNSDVKNINEEALACRVLYYDTHSDFAPACEDLSKEQINDQYGAMLTKTHFDSPKQAAQKVYVYIEKAKDTLLQGVQKKEEQAQIRQRQLKSTKQALREADRIIATRKRYPPPLNLSQSTFDFTRTFIPSAEKVILGIANRKTDSTRAKSIKAFNDECKAINSQLHADKNPLAKISQRQRLHDANVIINEACDEVKDLNTNNNQVRRVHNLKTKTSSPADLACSIYDNFCALLKKEIPSTKAENAKTTAQQLVNDINGSFGGTKKLEGYKAPVLHALASLQDNIQDVESKINDITSHLTSLDEGLEDTKNGPFLSKVSPEKNPFTLKQAQQALDFVLEAKTILETQYTSVKKNLSEQILKLAHLKFDLEYLSSQLNFRKEKHRW